MVMTVFSCLKVRLASLYGSVIRCTSCTPSSTSSSAVSNWREPPTAPSTVRSAPGRPVHVEAHFRQLGDHALHLRVARPFPHDYDHGYVLFLL